MEVILRAEAESDLAEAYRWYEGRLPGLGEEFLRSVDAAPAAIARQPEAHPKVHREIRRALLRRFPYGIFYLAEGDRVVVLGCLHVRRDPRRWQRRGR